MRHCVTAVVLTLVFSSCGTEQEKESTSDKPEVKKEDNTAPTSEFKTTTFKSSPIDFTNACTISPTEFIDLYPNTHSIPIDSSEKLFLVQELKKNGFTVENWGRGNFMEGPRLISFSLKKDDCKIRVDKLYYSTDTVGTFRVTERIKIEEN